MSCSEVTTEEARVLAEILVDAGIEVHSACATYGCLTTGSLWFAIPAAAPIGLAFIGFEPILPHGQWSLFPG
jgi:hypothetical protein